MGRRVIVSSGSSFELGPFLGRLVSPPDESSSVEVLLAPARLDLLTRVFERAGWREAWEEAVSQAGGAIAAEIDARLRDAARVSRFPARRLRPELPTAEDHEIMTARLAAAGIGYEAAIVRLDEADGSGRSERREEHLRRICGELEAAWERLVRTASEELERWDRSAARIRSWRRPWTPLLLGAGILLAIAIWLGLVLGGYLGAPSWLRPFAEWSWGLG